MLNEVLNNVCDMTGQNRPKSLSLRAGSHAGCSLTTEECVHDGIGRLLV